MCENDPKVNRYVREAINTMRFIASIGGSIYSLGYFFGYLSEGIFVRLLLGTVAVLVFPLRRRGEVREPLVVLRPRHGRVGFHPLRGFHG